ncbi:MAG: hypothetical protein HUU21_02425, partial [Polyangiaceae bacterium]|nr:hypothetical protein [Polyangiaceae bacterium]
PRGPDEGGEWLAPGVGLGSRRLSIIDVAGSQQPQAGPSGRTRVVYNGEVYNYRDLRAELVSRGHVLRTEGDTETLPHLFEEFGIEGCLERLVGMFAFALHDARDGALYLARDRLGIKPLYWTQAGGHLLFGSELKALLAHPACPREVDPGALLRYLLFEYVPSPGCIYRGVHKLSPGHYLVARDGHVEVREWWRPTFRKDGQGWKGSPLPPAGDARGWAAAVRADLRLLYFEAIQLYRRWEMSSPTARAERADFRLETRGALGHREASFKRTRTRSAAGRSIRIRFFAETKEMKGPLLLHIDS